MLRSLAIALTFIFTLNVTCVFAESDSKIQVSARNALRAYSLTTLHASVQKGSVILKGSVNSCRTKLLADEVVSRIHGVKTIQDGIVVLGPRVPDGQLAIQVNRIIADRIHKLGGFGYGSMTADVQNGAVTLSGTAAPEVADPAVDKIAGVIGVKNVIDQVHRIARFEPHWQSDFPTVTTLGEYGQY